VRIFSKQEERLYVLKKPISNAPVKDAKEEVRNEH
jgi:hypothetical protein